MDQYQEYREAVDFVGGFANTSLRNNYGPKRRDPSFYIDRMRHFLGLLGHPESGLKYVHVTGTSGKGTVSTMIHGMLQAAGHRVGLFTSPYVTTAVEEIRVNDLYIAPAEFAGIVKRLKPMIARAAASGPYGAPSQFEIMLAVAFLYFKKQKCDWVVLEVGLGGRYDATNVIRSPKATVITGIDYDHTEILGKTLRKIAYDKAGIIKKGSRFFTAERRPALVALFRKICREQGASFHQVAKQDGYWNYNVALARAVAASLGVPERALAAGLEDVRLPCRFEVMRENPTVVLDGAHNRSKIRSTISNLEKLRYRKLIVVLSVSNTNKDSRAIVEPLTKLADGVILTATHQGRRRSVHPKTLLPYVLKSKKKRAFVRVITDPQEAFSTALAAAKSQDCVLVVGSFYLAGEIRTRWYPERWVLKNRRSFRKISSP